MMENRTFAGIDVGTTTTKAVIINADKELLGRCVRRSGADLASAVTAAFEEAIARAGIGRDMIQAIVATGYGRKNVPFDKLRAGSFDKLTATSTRGGRAGSFDKLPLAESTPSKVEGLGTDRAGSFDLGRNIHLNAVEPLRASSFVHSTRTEIGCHAQGCYHYFPEAITVVDVGGQDSKITKLDVQGRRVGFKMNRKCAAGTGAFLEEIAHKLDIPVGDLNELAKAASKTAQIGSYCTVFTATEVLDRIRAGEKIDDIVRGLFDSVAKRILEMDTLAGRVIMTGGVVAFNDIVADLLSARAGVKVEIAPHPQEMGAFGAALFAERLFSSQ